VVAGETKDFIDVVSVLLGNGDGTFQPPRNYPGVTHFVALGDFNGDGNLDVAGHGAGGLSILLGNGDGTFQPGQTYAVGSFPQAVAVGDFNGDGIADLVVAGTSSDQGLVRILL